MVLAYVMRHASTENNSNGHYRGHLQLPLTREGILESHDSAAFLKTVSPKPGWVISSDLPSAKQSAQICASELGLNLMRPMKELRGMDIGSFAGKSKAEAEATLKECFKHPDQKCGGGDSPKEFDARCGRTLAAIIKTRNRTGKIPLVETHGSYAVFLMKRIGGMPSVANYQEPPVLPGGILKLTDSSVTPIFKPDTHNKPTYPPDHKAGMRVPKGGSSCANCEYLADNKLDCTSSYFIKWNGSARIPAPIDEFCSDWWESNAV